MITHLDSTSFTIRLQYFRGNSWRSSCFARSNLGDGLRDHLKGDRLNLYDRSSWLHGNSTLRRCLLCSIQKAFFASSSSASWHALFSTDFSQMTSWLSRCICWARRYISAHLRYIFWRANFSASLLVWRTAHLDVCLAVL